MATKHKGRGGKLPSSAFPVNWDAAASNEQGMRRADERETLTNSRGSGGRVSKSGSGGTPGAAGGVKSK